MIYNNKCGYLQTHVDPALGIEHTPKHNLLLLLKQTRDPAAVSYEREEHCYADYSSTELIHAAKSDVHKIAKVCKTSVGEPGPARGARLQHRKVAFALAQALWAGLGAVVVETLGVW
jgi:hypothetical protein